MVPGCAGDDDEEIDEEAVPLDPLTVAGFGFQPGDGGGFALGPLVAARGGQGAYAAPFASRLAGAEVAFLLGYYSFVESQGAWSPTSVTGLEGEALATQGDVSATLKIIGDGTVQLTLTAPEGHNRVSAAFACDPEDRFIGLGAQTTGMEHRGARVPIWVSEQGIGKSADIAEDELPLALVGRPYDSYFPVPFLINPAKGYGLLVEGTHRTVFHLCSDTDSAWRVETWSNTLTLTLFSGPDPTLALTRATAHMGRPPMPPDWAFLPWLSIKGGAAHVLAKATDVRAQEIPVSAIWSEDWLGEAINPITGNNIKYHWQWDPEHYPDLKGFIEKLHAMDLRFLGYFNPFVTTGFPEWDQAIEGGYLPKNPDGEPYKFPVLTFEGSVVDLTTDAGRGWLLSYLKAGRELGLDGWMADYAEWIPFDATFGDGRTGAEVSSDYPRLWQQVNREACSGECVFFVRSGFTGSSGLVPAAWGGDQNTDFGEDDGLVTALRIGVGLGLVGVGFYGSDIAGYTSSASEPSTKELYFRWTQLGAWSPIMRTHEGNAGPENWNFDEDADTLAHFRDMARVHTRHFPLWKSLMAEATRTGLPPMRHPALHHPRDEAMLATHDAYMVGSSIVVAPIVEQGGTQRKVTLPRRNWIDLRDDKQYPGGQSITVASALNKIPVFACHGALIPRLPTDVQTPTEAGSLSKSHLEVVAVLGADGEFVLWDGTTLRLTSLANLDPGPMGLPDCADEGARGCTTLAVGGKRRTYRLSGSTLSTQTPADPRDSDQVAFEFTVTAEAEPSRIYDLVVVFQ